MVDKQRIFLPCFVVCAIFSAVITAQVVDTDPDRIVVTENQRNVSLMCRVGVPIRFCTFSLPRSDQQIILEQGANPKDGMQYFGQGYQTGQCGVTIDRITESHNGPVKCSLFVDGRSVEGIINVIVAVAPSTPYIDAGAHSESFEVNSELNARCYTTGGNPEAQLTWFLDDEEIYQGVEPQTDQEYEEQGMVSEIRLRRFIHASDNGKSLVCRATHVAYPEGVSRTVLPITVSYPPQALPEKTVNSLVLGRTVDVTLEIRANPMPRTSWTIDGQTIEEGREEGRYSARTPEPVESGVFNVTLTIAGLTLEDLSKTYFLHAENAYGTQDYRVLLSSLDAEVDESGGVGIGGIIGIVLAVLIVLAAIALIIVARMTGRWCFRGASLNTDVNPDSEAQITPHSHEDDLHDEKLQQQNPAAHYESDDKTQLPEGGNDSTDTTPQKNGKHENGKQQPIKKQENGKADSKTNTPV